ncbi:MAG: ferrous iron transport protein A [Candidatus Hydrogenedentes bacterium]|nr:ferrous iron transport protein A [Candidatus Hydrogenedentota bacterium]
MYVETEVAVMDLSLTECAEGDDVFVVSLEVDSPISARLRVLGVLDGVPIRIARAGSPIIIEVGETRLCLRANEADHVRVCPAGFAWDGAGAPLAEDASPA